MTNYLIGLKEEFLFYIEDVTKIATDAKENTTKFYSKNTLLFFTKQTDVDFIIEWDMGYEISPKLQEKYGLSTPNTNIPDEEGEPTIPDTNSNTNNNPSIDEPVVGETTGIGDSMEEGEEE